jgi:glycerol-3-phosphate O-acyltransferase/dihydroxyacetone phosphate acyltransferase
MALGAMAKYDIRVKIQCVGLNYFDVDTFRSNAVVNFGEPYEIPRELAELYKTNKREAIG